MSKFHNLCLSAKTHSLCAQNTCFNFRHIRLLGNRSKRGTWDLFHLQVLDYRDFGVEVSSSSSCIFLCNFLCVMLQLILPVDRTTHS